MKPVSKLLFLLFLFFTSAYAKDERSYWAEQTVVNTHLAQNNKDCKQMRDNKTNKVVVFCIGADGQYQKVDDTNVDSKNVEQQATLPLTDDDKTDKNTEYIALKQEWQSKLPTASGNDLLMIYTRLIDLAPIVGEQHIIKQYIREMAFAWVRDGTQPGQECGFLKAVYEGLSDEEPSKVKVPTVSQEDILEIEYPYAKSCYKAGATSMATKLLDASFKRILIGVKLKDPDQINEMIILAMEVVSNLEKSNNRAEASQLSESIALIYYKNGKQGGYPLKAADWLIKAADANDKADKKEFLYKKAIEVVPKNEDYGKIVTTKKLANFYIESERYKEALSLLQPIEKIASATKDKNVMGFGYCEAGSIVHYYNIRIEDTIKNSPRIYKNSEKNLTKTSVSLLEKGAIVAKTTQKEEWAARCLYNLSFAIFNVIDNKSHLDDKRVFDLRLDAAERFAQLNRNRDAKGAFQSSAMTAFIYGSSYFGLKDIKADINKLGYKLGCQTYYRGVQLGLYKPEDEEAESLFITICYKEGIKRY